MSEVLAGVPGQNELRFRVRLHPQGLDPRARLEAPDGTPAAAAVPTVTPLERRGPARAGERRVGHRVHVRGLLPDEVYRLRVDFPDGTTWRSAPVRTLPRRLEGDFTIAAGSCFAFNKGHESIGAAFPPREHALDPAAVRLRFLTGDQIYLDLNPAGWPHLRAPDPWEVYGRHWHGPGYGQFLGTTPSAFLADDHEYWNNYPVRQLQIPWTWTESQRRRMGEAADEAFELYQAALNPAPGEQGSLPLPTPGFCRSFRLDVEPISFFALDTRSGRTPAGEPNAGFVRREGGAVPELDELERWVGELRGPGVLALAQPLVEQPARYRVVGEITDFKLPDYPEQYLRLWQALLRSRHDVVVVSGDIHVNRLSRITPHGVPGASGVAIYEVISSALSLIDTDQGKAPPSGALKIDASGAARRGLMLEVQHYPLGGTPARAERRSYATLTFRNEGPRVSCRVNYWRIEPHGAVPIQEWTLPLR
jgi:hypothetical protein